MEGGREVDHWMLGGWVSDRWVGFSVPILEYSFFFFLFCRNGWMGSGKSGERRCLDLDCV